MQELTDISTYKSNLRFKLVALFSNLRIQNVLLLVLAQVLASKYIFAQGKTWSEIFRDYNLIGIVFATVCAVSAGYLINNFYDFEADLINRPVKTSLENSIAQRKKLILYFFLNLMAFLVSLNISWRAGLFFASYIFVIWFYSHKLKSFPIIGIFTAALLQLLPFFVIFIYYRNFSKIIFVHATFLFLLILLKELIKSIENLDGDEVSNRYSFAVIYGVKLSKQLFTFLTLLMLVPLFYLLNYQEIGYMKLFFGLAYGSLLVANVILYQYSGKRSVLYLHFLLRLLLVLGVLSIVLLK
jgi:4-hydroxybenzoate polyprenyltransferase